ncbi:DUF294 nucleotidyltransferase-like domain-containing protein [Azospirillum sp. ST 5-10]|uniref:DUF294 nucleotidyltransferase-like domain-containing protein n=1 Tax=unclassified Azospirillum TaxID=2630922 RepID=UPI003F4A0D61
MSEQRGPDDALPAAPAAPGDRAGGETAALSVARIRDAYLHPAVFVDAAASLREAALAMRDRQATAVLVRDGGRTGILTGTDLRDLVVIDGLAVSEPVAPHARYSLITRDSGDLLLDALILMTRHAVRRIVVTEGGAIRGVLEQADLLGALSNRSQVVALQAERAATPQELARASHDTAALVRTLHATGVKVPFIAELVTELDRKIFRRLFELLAPPDLLANSCLIVMGSEGRGEQLLKTDQDNGLILRDGYVCPGLERVTQAFTRHLADFGYPPCPGNVMLSNPDWARPLAGYKDALFRWIHRPDETAPMNLAIFYDACAVAGDAALLDEARRYLLERVQDSQGFFFHFARPALAFDTPGGRFGGLFDWRGAHPVDVKKAGIFPLVHGVRALALEKHLSETNTLARIRALAERGVLDRVQAEELAESFTVLSTLRLAARLDAASTDNLVRPAAMSKLERDLFNDCLAVVKAFKQFLAHHFHLNLY